MIDALKEMSVMELIQLRKETLESNRVSPDRSNTEFIQEIDKHLDSKDLCNFCGAHH